MPVLGITAANGLQRPFGPFSSSFSALPSPSGRRVLAWQRACSVWPLWLDVGTSCLPSFHLLGVCWLAPRVAVSMFAAKLLGLGLGQLLWLFCAGCEGGSGVWRTPCCLRRGVGARYVPGGRPTFFGLALFFFERRICLVVQSCVFGRWSTTYGSTRP